MNATTRTMLATALGLAVTASAASAAASYRTGWRLHSTGSHGKPIVPSHHQGFETRAQPSDAADAQAEDRTRPDETGETVRVDPRAQVRMLADELAATTRGLERTAIRLARHDDNRGSVSKDASNEAKALANLASLDQLATRFDLALAEPSYDIDRLHEDFHLLRSAYRKAAYTKHYLGRWSRVDDPFESVTELIYALRIAVDQVDASELASRESDDRPDREARIEFRKPLTTWEWNRP